MLTATKLLDAFQSLSETSQKYIDELSNCDVTVQKIGENGVMVSLRIGGTIKENAKIHNFN